MKGKFKKIMAVMAAVMMTLLSLTGSSPRVSAAVATGIMVNETIKEDDLILVPGKVKHMRIPIRAMNGFLRDATVAVSASEGAPFSFSVPQLTDINRNPLSYLSDYGTTYVDFDVDVKETAGIGSWSIDIEVSSPEDEGTVSLKLQKPVKVQVLKPLAKAQITMGNINVSQAIIGEEAKISFVMRNEGEITARNTYYSLVYDGAPGVVPKYTTKRIKVGDLKPGEFHSVELPIGILTTAEPGLKSVMAKFEYVDVDGNPGSDSSEIYFDINKNENAPELVVDSISYEGTFKPGENVIVKLKLRNYGNRLADDVSVKLDDATSGEDGFYKNYFTDSVLVGSVGADKILEAKLPLTISKKATGGNKKLNLIVDYVDEKGNKYALNVNVYPEVIGKPEEVNEETILVLNNVSQSPESPAAGQSVTVSFDLQNKSKSDVTEIKLALQGLDGTTFIPKNSDPYIYIDKIEAGKTKRISVPLDLADTIPGGMNNLTVKYSYAENAAGDTVIIPVRNIQNDLGSASMPKLIISKYAADVEELRAGSTFNFTFDIHNTNGSVAAKNITITLKQAENIFSVTQGSNSFFINKIAPGETVQQTVEMKVKSDASTKAYELEVIIEYEYDGIKPNPETGEIGVGRTEKLNLQVVENSRPVVDYVNVYSWDGQVTVGNPATLSFEFYNMGKSPLNNVVATVEGDFTKADGNMFFLGTVEAGRSGYSEFDVIPGVEGLAKGTLMITFEDSNGDTLNFTKEFEATVTSATTFDPNMPGGDGSVDVFNPEVPAAKEPILKLWVFIIIQVVIFAAFIPITRKVIISIYKVKLRKKEQGER